MKVIQVNAWCGRVSGPLLRLIEEEKPDLVCMQETIEPVTGVLQAFKDQYDFINDVISRTNLKHSYFEPTWNFKMGGGKIKVGKTLISKHALTDRKSGFTNGRYHTRTIKKLGIPNTRKWQSAVVDTPEGKITIFNYHGYLTIGDPKGDMKTIETLKILRKAIENTSGPIIVCGDFNISPDSDGMKFFNEIGLINLTTKYKVQATLSELHRAPKKDRQSVACDYIFVTSGINVKSFEVSEMLVSDHKALILEFNL